MRICTMCVCVCGVHRVPPRRQGAPECTVYYKERVDRLLVNVMAINVVDISTGKVICVPLVCTALVGEPGHPLTKVKQLIDEVEAYLTKEEAGKDACVRVVSAMVGKKRIDICREQHSLDYYLFDSKPWYIQKAVYSIYPSATNFDLKVTEVGHECDGEAKIRVNLEKDLVKDLKKRYSLMTELLVCDIQFTLNYGRELLENGAKLSDYKLTEDSLITFVPIKRRRCEMQGIPLENIADFSPQTRKLAILTPVWRRATPGILLEGICNNELCLAYSEVVVMNQGFVDIDFINEKRGFKCPMCYEVVIPIAFGFNRCQWMIVGRKKITDKTSQIIRQNWQRVDKKDGYCRFYLGDDEHTAWLDLKLLSRSLERSNEFCVICMDELRSDRVRTKCGHQFHSKCFHLSNRDCIECFASEHMTEHQKLYGVANDDALNFI